MTPVYCMDWQELCFYWQLFVGLIALMQTIFSTRYKTQHYKKCRFHGLHLVLFLERMDSFPQYMRFEQRLIVFESTFPHQP